MTRTELLDDLPPWGPGQGVAALGAVVLAASGLRGRSSGRARDAGGSAPKAASVNAMAWLRWGALNLLLLGAVMVGGLLLLALAAAVGWGNRDSREYTYLFLWLYLPFTGTAYLALLALVGRRVRRPRLWALLLTPVLWAFVPVFAIGVNAPGIAATWVAYLVFGAAVKLP